MDGDLERGDEHPGNEGSYADPSGKLWTMYMDQAGEYDIELAESWKGDTDGIIIFTSLFSATVAAFLIESYQSLSPDSGAATVQLLTQLLNQTAALSIPGTQLPPPQPLPAFQPSASAIRVNAMWFASLILSVNCALAATLMQQWARQYLQVSKRQAAPHRRARIRAYLFEGVERFGMARAVEYLPALLHASVFLFFAGLFDFVLSTNTTVAWTILAFVSLSAGAYVLLTVHPIFYLNSPFRTPLSKLLWPWAYILSAVALSLANLLAFFRHCSTPAASSTDDVSTVHSGRSYLHKAASHCLQRFRAGMRRSIKWAAEDAPWEIDSRALKWTVQVLDEEHDWEQFAVAVPAFARSKAVGHAGDILVDLVTPASQTEQIPLVAERMCALLDTCARGEDNLKEDARTHRLLVCVTALWNFAEACNRLEKTRLPDHMRVLFANPAITRMLREEEDPQVAAIGRCMGALIARRLIRDVARRQTTYSDGASQALSLLLEEPPNIVLGYLSNHKAALALLSNLVVTIRGISPVILASSLSDNTMDIVARTVASLWADIRPMKSDRDSAFADHRSGVESLLPAL
ncbi:hypothetical protein BV25DRAFT_1832997 [Artomyces pyxidatus]|uniref:Uncharacterized protein n=1 Tax=Artomyces pyxidatus TaxID=48021 RepID=A0ACB8SIK0_9AGAM|nr:hypothetical protein BV25DRAFT_1832997 [Artomyces pyxidatus]